MGPMHGKHFLILVGDDYEDLELWYPKLRLIEADAGVTVAGSKGDTLYRGKHGYPCVSEAAIDQMEVEDFHGLIIPGGWLPDKLRREAIILDLVRAFVDQGKLVAAICHGGWVPISAGVYRGIRVTGSPGIKDDLINAGAIYEDAPVVVDGQFVSSRRPDDLPQFCTGIIEATCALPVDVAV